LLQPEARWLRDRLETLQPSDGPVLNVGSASAQFRSEVQPWIDAQVFAPLRARGLRVVHQDLQAAEGVDLVGDLLSIDAVQAARQLGVRSVICSNVLEHVPDPRAFALGLLALTGQGGRLLITVPHTFPYHPDPIDTLFRPTLDELHQLFPGTQRCAGALLPCGRLHNLALANPRRVLTRAKQTLLGLTSKPANDQVPADHAALSGYLPYLFRPFEVSALDLERVSA
jgi:hypothetical protein